MPFLIGILLFVGTLLGILIVIIFAIVCLITLARTIWLLFRTFANLLLLSIFSPLYIISGLFLPNVGGFSAWLKEYIANLAVFPTVGLLFMLGYTFLISAMVVVGNNLLPTNLDEYMQQLLGGIPIINLTLSSGWPPLLGSGTAAMTAFGFIGASFVILTMIPKSADLVKGLISGKPLTFGSAIGETTRPIAPLVGGLAVPQEEAARAAKVSPFAFGTARQRITYTIEKGLQSLLNQR